MNKFQNFGKQNPKFTIDDEEDEEENGIKMFPLLHLEEKSGGKQTEDSNEREYSDMEILIYFSKVFMNYCCPLNLFRVPDLVYNFVKFIVINPYISLPLTGFLIVSGVCFYIFAMVKGASLYNLFSIVPVLIIFGLMVFTGAVPEPFHKMELDFSYDEHFKRDECLKDILQFCISCFIVGPFCLALIIMMTEKFRNLYQTLLLFFGVTVLFVGSICLMCTIFTPEGFKKRIIEDQEE